MSTQQDASPDTQVPLPDQVYVPVAAAQPDQAETGFELRRLDDDRTALAVYSSLDQLVECCGAGQPWYLLHRTGALYLRDRLAADLLILDLPIPRDQWHPEPEET